MTNAAERPSSDWNPALYMKFVAERTRAARDLLAGVPLTAAHRVADLGCGPGNSAELLAARFPEARILGLDTSEAMLGARARARSRRALRQAGHRGVVARGALRSCLRQRRAAVPAAPTTRCCRGCSPSSPKGGYLAVQMPITLHEASHAAMRLVAAEGPWARRLAPIVRAQPVIAAFEAYYEWLAAAGGKVEVWTTTYVHTLDGAAGRRRLVRRLRPHARSSTRSTRPSARRFFPAIARRSEKLPYAPRADGKVLLPYPRLFIVALKIAPPLPPRFRAVPFPAPSAGKDKLLLPLARENRQARILPREAGRGTARSAVEGAVANPLKIRHALPERLGVILVPARQRRAVVDDVADRPGHAALVEGAAGLVVGAENVECPRLQLPHHEFDRLFGRPGAGGLFARPCAVNGVKTKPGISRWASLAAFDVAQSCCSASVKPSRPPSTIVGRIARRRGDALLRAGVDDHRPPPAGDHARREHLAPVNHAPQVDVDDAPPCLPCRRGSTFPARSRRCSSTRRPGRRPKSPPSPAPRLRRAD